jgi:hypothetical protein
VATGDDKCWGTYWRVHQPTLALCYHCMVWVMCAIPGADPHKPSRDVSSPLHAVAQRGQLSLMQLLLEYKADVRVADSQGWTPLHLAARAGNAQKVQCLLSAGAPVAAVNSQGNTPLHLVRSLLVMVHSCYCCCTALLVLDVVQIVSNLEGADLEGRGHHIKRVEGVLT